MSEPALTVGIAGAGAVACATAALLATRGHRPLLWSPSGASTDVFASRPLTAGKAVEGAFPVEVAGDAKALAAADVILIAAPANAHKMMFDAIAPYVRAGQPIIVSSHASFGALYLSMLLAQRGVAAPLIVWGTTVATARRGDPGTVTVNTVRARVDVATLPHHAIDDALTLCIRLFGDRFVPRDGLLAIAVSNLNPQNHMGIALANMTRMEHGETWSQGGNVTGNVGRLLEALDTERLTIAAALGVTVRTIFEHFSLSFHVPAGPVAEMNAQMHEAGNGGTGPATADSRYVTEDVPFGLLPTVALGALVDRPARLHEAGVDIFSAMYGRDFVSENDLLPAIGFQNLSLADLRALCRDGYAASSDRHETRNAFPNTATGA